MNDYNKLSKLVEHKTMVNVRHTAGSMFDYIEASEAGVKVKEN